MRSIRAAVDTVSIWVRGTEESSTTFVYRAVSSNGSPPQCYHADPSRDARANWTILSQTPLAIPACADLSGPPADGMLYVLSRAS